MRLSITVLIVMTLPVCMSLRAQSNGPLQGWNSETGGIYPSLSYGELFGEITGDLTQNKDYRRLQWGVQAQGGSTVSLGAFGRIDGSVLSMATFDAVYEDEWLGADEEDDGAAFNLWYLGFDARYFPLHAFPIPIVRGLFADASAGYGALLYDRYDAKEFGITGGATGLAGVGLTPFPDWSVSPVVGIRGIFGFFQETRVQGLYAYASLTIRGGNR